MAQEVPGISPSRSGQNTNSQRVEDSMSEHYSNSVEDNMLKGSMDDYGKLEAKLT